MQPGAGQAVLTPGVWAVLPPERQAAAVAMLAVALLLLWKAKKLPEPLIVAAAALAGLVVHPLIT